MSKMQIIAKTVLMVLGLWTVVMLFQHLSVIIRMDYFASGSAGILYLVGYIVVAALLVYFIIFRNDSLACKMAGDGEEPDAVTQRIWLATSLRLGAVFCGLVLLSGSIAIVVTILSLLWPANIRAFITDIITSGSLTSSVDLSGREWFARTYGLIKAILAIYLLCGAPWFVRWQLKHSIAGSWRKNAKNLNSHNANSERTGNE